MIPELKRLIDQVSRDKGIERSVLIETLLEAIKSAARKKFGPEVDFEVIYNEERGELEAYQFKIVVEEVDEPELEISYEEGKGYDPGCLIGDELGVKMDTSEFGRIAAQSAKQVIIQRMKDAERDVIYEEFKDRQGQIIHGIVQRVDRAGIIVTLGRAEALLPIREQVPRENYRPGDRIRAHVMEVNRAGKGPQIILSRSHPSFLIQLFTAEVPELGEGIVKIMSVAREPGSRAKVAVTSSDPDIDPVGACVGMRGSRVQAVSQELRGEKIDIIKYDPDPVKFVCNGLQPAIISKVVLDQMKRVMLIIVKDDQLSQAIGRKGQNVRLASQLTGWDLDVVSESRYSKASADGYKELLTLKGVGAATADALFDAGWQSVDELAEAPPEELATIPGVGLTKATDIINSAKERLETLAAEGSAQPEGDEAEEAPAEEAPEEAAPAEEAPEEEAPAEEAPAEEAPEEEADAEESAEEQRVEED